jgi:hypothetical protein
LIRDIAQSDVSLVRHDKGFARGAPGELPLLYPASIAGAGFEPAASRSWMYSRVHSCRSVDSLAVVACLLSCGFSVFAVEPRLQGTEQAFAVCLLCRSGDGGPMFLACGGCGPPPLEGSLAWAARSALHPMALLASVLAVAAIVRLVLRRGRMATTERGLCPARVLLAVTVAFLGVLLSFRFLNGAFFSWVPWAWTPWPRVSECGTLWLALFLAALVYHARRPRLRSGTWLPLTCLGAGSIFSVTFGYALVRAWQGRSTRVPYELSGVVSSETMTLIYGFCAGLTVCLVGSALGQLGARFPRAPSPGDEQGASKRRRSTGCDLGRDQEPVH